MNNKQREKIVPLWERVMLTVEEASTYTGIGVRTLKQLSDDPNCTFVVWVGNRRMFKRKALDEFLEAAYEI